MTEKTVPFFNVSRADRSEAINFMRERLNGDPENLDIELVKTAFKSQIGKAGSNIVGVPKVVAATGGPTFHIPLKNSLPAMCSLAWLRKNL